MWIIADTHAHWYDHFDPREFWTRACERFRAHATTVGAADPREWRGILCLIRTATAGDLGTWVKQCRAADGMHVAGLRANVAATVVNRAGERLIVLATRQIVTRERVEVLGVGVEACISDGQPMEETIRRVLETGGQPLLPWSPGKWWGRRGRLIREMLMGHDASSCLVGDTTLRPRGWPRPALFRWAEREGFRIVAGSDPLPIPGEERQVARYVSAWVSDFDDERPDSEVIRLLKGRPPLRTLGTRSTVSEWMGRLGRHLLRKRSTRTPASNP